MRTTDQTITMDDGAAIRTVRHEPDAGASAGVIQFVHGFGEHVGMYERLAKFCTEHGYAFVIHDQRGHGELLELSPQARAKAIGVVRSYALFLSDITAVRAQIDGWYPGLPVYLWGLSMGGQIVATCAERVRQPRFDKVVLESPWLRLAEPKPAVVTTVARAIGRLHPHVAIEAGLDLDAVTRDPAENQALRDDPYYHGRISLRLYAQIVDANVAHVIRNGVGPGHPRLPAQTDTEAINSRVRLLTVRCTIPPPTSNQRNHHPRNQYQKSTKPTRIPPFRRSRRVIGERKAFEGRGRQRG